MDEVAKHITQKTEVDDELEVNRIKRGVRLHVKMLKNSGVPIAKFDLKAKRAYLEYADGRKDYDFAEHQNYERCGARCESDD
jgi:hypothetical protein